MNKETISIESRAIEWLLGDDIGASSKVLCAYMLGRIPYGSSHPHDASDRGRCIRLLRRIPEWIPRLDEMTVIDPPSNAIVIDGVGIRKDTNSWSGQIPLIKKEMS